MSAKPDTKTQDARARCHACKTIFAPDVRVGNKKYCLGCTKHQMYLMCSELSCLKLASGGKNYCADHVHLQLPESVDATCPGHNCFNPRTKTGRVCDDCMKTVPHFKYTCQGCSRDGEVRAGEKYCWRCLKYVVWGLCSTDDCTARAILGQTCANHAAVAIRDAQIIAEAKAKAKVAFVMCNASGALLVDGRSCYARACEQSSAALPLCRHHWLLHEATAGDKRAAAAAVDLKESGAAEPAAKKTKRAPRPTCEASDHLTLHDTHDCDKKACARSMVQVSATGAVPLCHRHWLMNEDLCQTCEMPLNTDDADEHPSAYCSACAKHAAGSSSDDDEDEPAAPVTVPDSERAPRSFLATRAARKIAPGTIPRA